jgi:N6-adenosine-specific RNA methylase IME4
MSKKYQIIYADPPWAYRDKRDKHPRLCGGASVHYPTMGIEQIKALPIGDITAESAMLFMWATFPNLQEALDTIKAWGFKYKTLGFSWIKTNKKNGRPFFGIGWYTKSNCEVCLIGVKGRPFKVSNSVSSVVIEPKQEHSRKPAIVRDRIVELCGDVPRVELFARNAAPGWDVWGNQVKSDLDLYLSDSRCTVCEIETGLCCSTCQTQVCANCTCPTPHIVEVVSGEGIK